MQLPKRQYEIISYMRRLPAWHTGKELSSLFSVSLRTIRNDIAAINDQYGCEAIESNKYHGYRYNSSFSVTDAEISDNSSNDQRIHQLTILLFTNPNRAFEFIDLAEQFYISEYTLGHDITAIRKLLVKYGCANLFISRDSEQVQAAGDIDDCAKFLHNYLKESRLYQNEDDFDHYFINASVPEITEKMRSDLQSTVFTRYLAWEDILILSAVYLEICMNISAPMHETLPPHGSEGHDFLIPYLKDLTSSLPDDQQQFISEHFMSTAIPLITLEKEEILIKTTTTSDDPIYPLLLEILTDVRSKYGLDICSQEKLILDFLKHIKIALLRVQRNVVVSNPMIEYIRLNYNFLFDVAFYIANSLSEKLNLKFSSEEISFFVVYLINPLRMIKEELIKDFEIRILLYTMEGTSITANIREYLLNHLENRLISIDACDSTAAYLEKDLQDYDLLITTSTHLSQQRIPCCTISSYATPIELTKINHQVAEIYIRKRKFHFEQLFDYFFSDGNSSFSSDCETQEECIRQICGRLTEMKFVPDDFVDQVLHRESLLSTGFDSGIALPHSTENSALKSQIYYMSLRKPIDWDGLRIKHVFLFAIANEDINILNLIYRIIIDICQSDAYIAELNKVSTFAELKNLLFAVHSDLLQSK